MTIGCARRAPGAFKLSPIEVGIDSQTRLSRATRKGEILCASMHGDYRYDELKNTPEELQKQEAALRAALIHEMADTSLIVCGYSGRDESVMEALRTCYQQPGSGVLYWCGFANNDMTREVLDLIAETRAQGRQAFYVPTLGFDDLMTRLALHCLEGDARKAAAQLLEEFAPKDKLAREPFRVAKFNATTLIKSNAFPLECPSEMLQFDLQAWPAEKVWTYVRERIKDRPIVAAPLKGKVFALGTIDDIKAAFADNIKGVIERVPVAAKDLTYEDGAIVSLMRGHGAAHRSIAGAYALATRDQRRSTGDVRAQVRAGPPAASALCPYSS